jgi:hypothetical protein
MVVRGVPVSYRLLPLGLSVEELGGPGSDFFYRYHLTPWRWWPLRWRLYLHCFRQPDTSPPHDHPFSFVSLILWGGYTEEVYARDSAAPGGWRCRLVRRRPGTGYRAPADYVHRIVRLHGRRCYTLMLKGPEVRGWRHYQELLRVTAG